MECCRSQGARSPRAATVLRVALLAAALCLLAAAGWSAKAEAAGTTIAAVGDMGCSPTDNSYRNGNGRSSSVFTGVKTVTFAAMPSDRHRMATIA